MLVGDDQGGHLLEHMLLNVVSSRADNLNNTETSNLGWRVSSKAWPQRKIEFGYVFSTNRDIGVLRSGKYAARFDWPTNESIPENMHIRMLDAAGAGLDHNRNTDRSTAMLVPIIDFLDSEQPFVLIPASRPVVAAHIRLYALDERFCTHPDVWQSLAGFGKLLSGRAYREMAALFCFYGLGLNDSKSKLVKTGADSAIIQNDIEIDQNTAELLTQPARRIFKEERIDGEYKLLKVDSSKPEGFKVTIQRVNHAQELTFDATVERDTLSIDSMNLLKNAQWQRKTVSLKINGKRSGGEVTSATIVEVKEV